MRSHTLIIRSIWLDAVIRNAFIRWLTDACLDTTLSKLKLFSWSFRAYFLFAFFAWIISTYWIIIDLKILILLRIDLIRNVLSLVTRAFIFLWGLMIWRSGSTYLFGFLHIWRVSLALNCLGNRHAWISTLVVNLVTNLWEDTSVLLIVVFWYNFIIEFPCWISSMWLSFFLRFSILICV